MEWVGIFSFFTPPVGGVLFCKRKYTFLPRLFSQGGYLAAGTWHLIDIGCQEERMPNLCLSGTLFTVMMNCFGGRSDSEDALY